MPYIWEASILNILKEIFLLSSFEKKNSSFVSQSVHFIFNIILQHQDGLYNKYKNHNRETVSL